MLALSALSDPTRLRIVEMLAASGRLPVGEISRKFTMSPPAISQHLKVLKRANLVKAEVSAQQRIYSLNPAGISEIENWISQVRAQLNERFDALDALMKEDRDNDNNKEGS